MLAAFLSTILLAVAGVTGSRSSRILGGTEAHFWRLSLAMILLGLFVHSLGPGLSGAGLGFFLVSGAIGFGIGDVALFQALPRLGGRLSMMLVLCLSSPMAAWMEYVWLGTTLSLVEILSALCILIGVAMALAPREHPHLARHQLVPGVAFGLLAAFCQGLGAVLSRRAFEVSLAAGEDLSGLTTAYQRIVAGVAVTAICLLVVKRSEVYHLLRGASRRNRWGWRRRMVQKRDQWRRAWPWVVLNGLAGPTFGVGCFQWALKTTPTGIVLPIVALTPLVIIPLSRWVEGERPTSRSLLGGVIAVAGAVVLALVSQQND